MKNKLTKLEKYVYNHAAKLTKLEKYVYNHAAKLTKLEKYVYNHAAIESFHQIASDLNRTVQSVSAAFNRACIKTANA